MDEKLKKIEKLDREDKTSFTDMLEMTYITPQNSSFSLSKNGFLQLVSSLDIRPEHFGDEEDGNGSGGMPPRGGRGPRGPGGPGGMPPPPRGGGHGRKEPLEIKFTPDGKRDYGRVLLHRAFPFDFPDGIISVLQEDGLEIGIIEKISDFDEKTAKILRDNLDKKYFVPQILKILSAKDRYGFVYFTCETDKGKVDFVMRNPFGSIIRLGENRLYLIDIDGNRYSIPDASRLDKKSYRKIELYL